MFPQRNISDNNNGNSGDDLSFALLAHANNHLMSDVVLVSADGDQVPASRFVLGARSPVLQKLLFDGSRSEVRIPYSGIVVRAMVEFCRSNSIQECVPILTRDAYSIRQVVHLSDCAKKYKLQKLEDIICNLVTDFLWSDGQNFSWVCSIFDEAVGTSLDDHIGESSLPLMRLVMESIRSDPNLALLRGQEFQPPGVLFLSPHSLEIVIRDQRMDCEEITLFLSLEVWNNAKKQSSSRRRRGRSTMKNNYDELSEEDDISFFSQRTRNDDDASVSATHYGEGGSSKRWFNNKGTKGSRNQKQKNHPTAEKLAAAIDLSRIAPSDLCGTVSKSGLVPESAIWRALKETALRTEREQEAPTSKIRKKGSLKSTREEETQVTSPAYISNQFSQEQRSRLPMPTVDISPVQQPERPYNFANFSSPSPHNIVQQQTTPMQKVSKVTPQSKTPQPKKNYSPGGTWEGADECSLAIGSVDGKGVPETSMSEDSIDQTPNNQQRRKSRLIRLAEKLDPHLSCLCG